MKRKIKNGTGLYAFLETTGVLATGTVEEIENQKKRYWVQYRKEWKKNKRQQSKVYVVMVSFKDSRRISQKAKAIGVTPASYLKHCALNDEVILGPVLIAKIREQFVLYTSKCEELLEMHLVNEPIQEQVMEELINLEKNVMELIAKRQGKIDH